jgi:hypothetical protein
VQGKEVPNPCTAIRLFSLLDHMKWNHLPVAGGLYDQNPDLLMQFEYIFGERAKQQEKENRKQRAEADRNNNSQQRLMRQSSRMH